jgi:hypothetical protein
MLVMSAMANNPGQYHFIIEVSNIHQMTAWLQPAFVKARKARYLP